MEIYQLHHFLEHIQVQLYHHHLLQLLANGGCLTFVFTSNAAGVSAGWDATIYCTPPITCPKPINLTATNVGTTSAQLNWTEWWNRNTMGNISFTIWITCSCTWNTWNCGYYESFYLDAINTRYSLYFLCKSNLFSNSTNRCKFLVKWS